MGKEVLVGLVVILMIAGIGLVSYGLFSSVRVTQRLANATKDMDQFGQGLIEIHKAYFHVGINDTECSKPDRIVILDIAYTPNRMPRDCDILVDGRTLKHLRLFEYECRNCSIVESMIDIEALPVDIGHKIEICCQGICSHRQLKALCYENIT